MIKRADRLVSPFTSPVRAWVCALMISFCVMKAIQARPRVAVLELRDYASLSSFELKSVTQLLRGAVARDGRYLVLTQENITALLPSELRLEDCEGSCEVETGRTLGVALTMTGEVGRIDGDLSLMLRLFSSYRADMVAQASLSAPHLRALHEQLPREVRGMFEQVHAGDRARERAAWLLGSGALAVGLASAWWLLELPSAERGLEQDLSQFTNGPAIRESDARLTRAYGIGWGLTALSVGLLSWSLSEWLRAPASSAALLYGEKN